MCLLAENQCLLAENQCVYWQRTSVLRENQYVLADNQCVLTKTRVYLQSQCLLAEIQCEGKEPVCPGTYCIKTFTLINCKDEIVECNQFSETQEMSDDLVSRMLSIILTCFNSFNPLTRQFILPQYNGFVYLTTLATSPWLFTSSITVIYLTLLSTLATSPWLFISRQTVIDLTLLSILATSPWPFTLSKYHYLIVI